MQSQLFALSGPVVTVPSPLDALAEELGSESARIERELRRELATGMAEIQRELETIRRHNAELELRVITAEHTRDSAIRDRLATLRDGENGTPGASVTVDDVRPVIAAEVTRQWEAAPKPPSTDEIEAIAATELERRIDDVAKRAADLVPVPEMPLPPELPDIPALIADEISNREDDIVNQTVARVSDTVSEQIQRVFPGIAQRAAELVTLPEIPDIPTLIADEISNREDDIVNQAVSRVSETVVEKMQLAIPGIAKRAAELVLPPDLPDILALIADEISNREDDIVDHAVSLTRETVTEQIQRVFPGIAQRAAELVPPSPELPDFPALIANEISNREVDLAERVAALVRLPEAPILPDIGAMVDGRVAAAFVTVRVPQDGADADPEVTAALVQQKVDEAIGRLAPTFVSQAEIEVISQAVVDRALAQLPKDISADEVRTVVEEELSRHLEALPKALSADDIDALAQAAAEVAVDRCVPDIAQRAAGLIPPVDPPVLPDIDSVVAQALESKVTGIAERAAALIVVPDARAPSADEIRPLVAEEVKAQVVGLPETLDIPGVVDEALGARTAEIAERAAALVVVPEPKMPGSEEIRPLVVDEVKAQISELPGIPDVSDAIQEALNTRTAEIVERVVALIVVPDARAPSSEEIRPIVAEEVKAQISDLPETLDIPGVIDEALNAKTPEIAERAAALVVIPEIKTPSAGEIRAVVVDEVKAQVAELPPPERGPKGDDGPPGKLPTARAWANEVHYEGTVVTHAGATWQALRDTGREPPHEDWSCLAASGINGIDGRSFSIRGTYSREILDYRHLDVVAMDGNSFAARRDNPGPCPGEGWQLIAQKGKPGQKGERGFSIKGDKGSPGDPVVDLSIDAEGMQRLVNGDGSIVTCDMYPVLAKLK